MEKDIVVWGGQHKGLPAGGGGGRWLVNGQLLQRGGRAALRPHNLIQWTLWSLVPRTEPPITKRKQSLSYSLLPECPEGREVGASAE